MNSKRSSIRAMTLVKVEPPPKINYTVFPGITETIEKEKETIITNKEDIIPNNENLENILENDNLYKNTALEMEKENLPTPVDNNNIKNENDESKTGEFFKENINSTAFAAYENYKINVFNANDSNDNKFQNLITGLSVYHSQLKEDRIKNMSFNMNTIEVSKPRDRKTLGTELGTINTIDYSSIDDGDKSPTYSPSKILRKYNLNPYHNFNVVKKYFIYQLKKSFLQAKKFVLNNNIHMKTREEFSTRATTNYHEIFTNYSQISTATVNSYIKYEDKNIKINNYYIKKNKVLGKGGFSTVYMCKNLKDGQDYAVKITDKKVRANAKMRKYDYVKDEVNILKRLYSRYIVKTYEILETKNECLIFMELMKNNSLYSKINKLDEFKIWKYFRNLICGVEHCHEIAKIIHRDINVNNLLISDDDILKLSDFGVSMIIEDDNPFIPVNSGPTTYTPPEKKNEENTHYDGKPADIWCCGVALYHMVYKRPLFKNFATLQKSDYKIILPDDPDELIDNSLKDLMLKLLDENPENRYTFNDMKKNIWITKNGEFPLPDIHEEALEYVYSLTTKELRGIKEEEISHKGDSSPY